MTRVKMLKTSAGPAGVRMVGQIVDVPDDEALALLTDRAVILVNERPVIESAMVGGGERAVTPLPRPRRR